MALNGRDPAQQHQSMLRSLGRSARELPARLLRHGFIWLSHRRALGRLAVRTRWTRGVVHRFVAGLSLDEAMSAIDRLRATGFLTTVDVLGEAVSSPADAEAAVARYLATLDGLASAGPQGNVSLKLTHLGLELDPDLCRTNLGRILERAAAHGAFVRIDMEDSPKTEITLQLWREVHPRYPNVGVVIQAYLRRSAADVERLIGEGGRVRLCKGAYDEPAAVAFPTKAEVDENYARLTERLLAEGNYPAIATHDERLIEHATRFAERKAIPPDRFEFQMLFGVRRDLQERLLWNGYRVRVYVPYGAEWYPYFMRRLAERPANVFFVVRSMLREGLRGATA